MNRSSLFPVALALAGSLALALQPARAADAADPDPCSQPGPAWLGACRLLPYETNAIVHRSATGDDSALRGDFSLRYVAWASDGALRTIDHPVRLEPGAEAFISYTGEFDYYMLSRPSSPVVNRISNPALHLRWYAQGPMLDWVDFGLEHSSDGQTIGSRSERDIARAQEEYAAGNHRYFDGISRSMNFVSGEAAFGNEESVLVRTRVKYFATTDSDITWGPLAGTNTSFRDYDRYRLIVEHRFGDLALADVTYRAGDRGFATDSVDVGLSLDQSHALPLYLRLHSGPMATLSDYTRSQRMIAVGLRFSE
ncbi:hypothetical protein [Derxia gummosa]|uniref:Uncharacterized protein n=1 Tax=Derxia gummosa DSM 723 TaxID=1121388 RepID=A0A8B6X155_9BURK|nr:hypothetical protein [Derxia gummosa]